MSLLYLRKGILLHRNEEYRESKKLLKYALRKTKTEDVSIKLKGEILFNLNIAYCGLAKKRFKKYNYLMASIYYKRSIKYGHCEKLPQDSHRDKNWVSGKILRGSFAAVVVLVGIGKVTQPAYDKYKKEFEELINRLES